MVLCHGGGSLPLSSLVVARTQIISRRQYASISGSCLVIYHQGFEDWELLIPFLVDHDHFIMLRIANVPDISCATGSNLSPNVPETEWPQPFVGLVKNPISADLLSTSSSFGLSHQNFR